MISPTSRRRPPLAPSKDAPNARPLDGQPPEHIRETLRQLAEITEQCRSGLACSSISSASVPPPATTMAISTPALPARRPAAQRDRLALAKMAHITARAEAQHDGTREYFTVDGVMPTVDARRRAIHVSTPLHLPGIGAANSRGTRPYQQDVAVADWTHAQGLPMAAVCDGHGVDRPGDATPWHWLQDHLIATLRAHLAPAQAADDLMPDRIGRVLTRAIAGSRARPRGPLSVVEQMDQVNAVENGSTLTAAVRIADTVYLANVGDSRAVLVRKDGSVQQMTVDHKIDEPQEWDMVQSRVLSGDATMLQTHPGVYRMVRYDRSGAVFGIAMSRSIGDDQATVSTPDISAFQVTPEDLALVLCSDGVFDSMHNEQVGQYVKDTMSLAGDRDALYQQAAEGLVSWCFDIAIAREKSQANIDNLTALILPLHEAL